MGKIRIQGLTISCQENETVLDALIRVGENVRFSCKKGICRTCRLDLVEGQVPPAAKRPFPESNDPGFLPCLCVPEGTITVAYPTNYQSQNEKEESPYEFQEENGRDKPPPTTSLMGRLTMDDSLNKILHSFYTEVYEDEQLRPFFKSVTKERAIEKQYNFLSMLFSGKENYLGALPRNAHHWMVISEELFEYRETMMEKHMIRHGLEERFRQQWKEKQAFFKSRIVKSRPWHKIIDGYHYPLTGLEEIKATMDMVCDGCHSEILQGTRAKYHAHSGEVYCPNCQELER